ncbi:unnamed protein product, partial [Ectocarpus sp. 4 AP-2014]
THLATNSLHLDQRYIAFPGRIQGYVGRTYHQLLCGVITRQTYKTRTTSHRTRKRQGNTWYTPRAAVGTLVEWPPKYGSFFRDGSAAFPGHLFASPGSSVRFSWLRVTDVGVNNGH